MKPEFDTSAVSNGKKSWIEEAKRPEWFGQTIASICWIYSVFLYGITSSGDWLQLVAGIAWLIANISSLYRSADR